MELFKKVLAWIIIGSVGLVLGFGAVTLLYHILTDPVGLFMVLFIGGLTGGAYILAWALDEVF